MKAILLAGGSGTRLYPITYAVNKHLLPVYNKPMIYYSLSTIMLAEIREVVVVADRNNLTLFKKLFGNGRDIGMRINYAVQDKPLGIVDAINRAKEFIGDEAVFVVLGDNLFYGHGLPEMLKTARGIVEDKGACIFGYFVPDPERYGIIEYDRDYNVISIEEKPLKPKSNCAAIGLYFYDKSVFEKIKMVKPSGRNELEITSLNTIYLKEKSLKLKILGRGFAWFDMGTYYSFIEASEFVYTIERRTGTMIGCIEEIAYRNGWIKKVDVLEIAKKYRDTEYAKYLKSIV